jgi:hypothetical protein
MIARALPASRHRVGTFKRTNLELPNLAHAAFIWTRFVHDCEILIRLQGSARLYEWLFKERLIVHVLPMEVDW